MNPRLPLFMFCADKNNKTSTGLRKTLSVSCGRDDEDAASVGGGHTLAEAVFVAALAL